MRPALISRSASLPIASMSARPADLGGWDEVTIYMKRIGNLPFEAELRQGSPQNCLAMEIDDPGSRGIDSRYENIFDPVFRDQSGSGLTARAA